MRVLLVCNGKDIEMLSLMGPLSKINPIHHVDIIIPARFKNQMVQLPNIKGVMCLSDFGIQDVFGWRKLPPKITALFQSSYDKIIDLSLSVLNPGFAIDDTIEKCASIYSNELNKHLGGSHECSLWLGQKITSSLPENAIVIEPIEYSFWIQSKPRELREFLNLLKSYGLLVVSNNDKEADLNLQLDLFSYAKIMAAAPRLLCFGGVFSKCIMTESNAKIMNWASNSSDIRKQLHEILISPPTINDVESFLLSEESNEQVILDIKAQKTQEDTDFIISCFRNYCCREPSEQEVNKHLSSLLRMSHEEKMLEMAYCAESVAKGMYRNKSKIYPAYAPLKSGKKVALLLSGHLRTYEKTYPTIMKNIVEPLNADVFIHTWDGIGKQLWTNNGPIPNENEKVDGSKITHFGSHLKGIRVDCNKDFLSNAKMKDRPAVVYGDRNGPGSWVGLSADPVLIESQLYSVNKAFDLMENYSIENGQYDLVIRMRSDLSANGLFPELEYGLDDNSIYIPSPPQSEHDHPPCPACQMGRHHGEHGTDVCDIFAYGTQKAMKKCCTLWDSLNEVWDLCEQQNEATFKLLMPVGKVGIHKVVNIWHSPNTHRVNCFYPERLLRKHLKDLRLLGSKLPVSLIR